ncbi:MAG: Lactoylglutathione lyase [Candidatus Taylorbacteria bacterium]|nr:Lactoylglutathione lyase [Candidatus Taylorbacteria bacterium]
MENTISYFEIQSSNPLQSVEFYKKVFGWNFVKEELMPIEYYRMTETSGIMGAILKRPAQVPAPEQGTNAFTCSIKVKNFDDTQKTIIENGGAVALPKFAVPGRCWQGYFLDNDHNVFGIFEPDENAR